MFGLGRTSNYIQAVFYGVSSSEASWTNSWQGVIPNSQLVAVPYKPSNPAYWTLELFLSPSGIVFWVLVSVFVMLLGLGGTLVYFRVRERNEDKRAREQGRHLFDFNAL
jgi:integrin alpha FG-GAP repeat containing protein 1